MDKTRNPRIRCETCSDSGPWCDCRTETYCTCLLQKSYCQRRCRCSHGKGRGEERRCHTWMMSLWLTFRLQRQQLLHVTSQTTSARLWCFRSFRIDGSSGRTWQQPIVLPRGRDSTSTYGRPRPLRLLRQSCTTIRCLSNNQGLCWSAQAKSLHNLASYEIDK